MLPRASYVYVDDERSCFVFVYEKDLDTETQAAIDAQLAKIVGIARQEAYESEAGKFLVSVAILEGTEPAEVAPALKKVFRLKLPITIHKLELNCNLCLSGLHAGADAEAFFYFALGFEPENDFYFKNAFFAGAIEVSIADTVLVRGVKIVNATLFVDAIKGVLKRLGAFVQDVDFTGTTCCKPVK